MSTMIAQTAGPKIVFQGIRGANSHIACKDPTYESYVPTPCPTFEDAVNAVLGGEAELAMIPVENSVAGRVSDIHHLMPNAGLYIIAELFVPIGNLLLAPKGAKLSDIKSVESHIMALDQCRNFFRKNKVNRVVAVDTAAAARDVAERNDPTCAAIAPRLAAELYNLDVLDDNIGDDPNAMTRFLVLSRQYQRPPRGSGPMLTTFVFEVKNIPAALYKALGGFATNGVNMTKLESYMLDGTFSATQFYSDVEGHPHDPGLKLALKELKFFTREDSHRILGVYPAHKYRQKMKEQATLSRALRHAAAEEAGD
jgi:prephenate dehydratase